jgi:KUP system potassium uptake protein
VFLDLFAAEGYTKLKADMSSPDHANCGAAHGSKASIAKLSLGALGVVYGDIGTSPLYAMKECFAPGHGVAVNALNVFGIVSLVFWSLALVVVLKYLSFVMRADNQGEGGILALLALLKPAPGRAPVRGIKVLTMLALAGAALLYGDGMITPSLSVLSAIEGLEVAKIPDFHLTIGAFEIVFPFTRLIVPLTIAVLVALFLAQRGGTARIGAVFGPAMLVWFVVIAAIAIPKIVGNPAILGAVNPKHAIVFFLTNKVHGFLVLGSVVLCITGGEALYADMGHFGKVPIRIAWYAIVYPSLILNYMGQGALLLSEPSAVSNPFYQLVSGWAVYPLVAIATFATVVASQALISGAFSLTQQAVQLGYSPRVQIVHTSGEAEGQIYIPEVNNLLMITCILLVLGFKTSSSMAAAYGIAVTGTMGVTSILFFAVARTQWGWGFARAFALTALFLVVDLGFFAANAVKIADGGWFPLVIGAGVLVMMTTWKRGRQILYDFIKSGTLPIDVFLKDVIKRNPVRVRGTAVFMTSNPEGAPPVLLHHFKHNKVLHEQVVLLSVATMHTPEIGKSERISVLRELGSGFYQVTASYGFMQTPNVQEVLEDCAHAGLKTSRDDTSFFLGRETLLVTNKRSMATWRKLLFVFLSKNARPANAFFRIPPNRVVELGTQIEL